MTDREEIVIQGLMAALEVALQLVIRHHPDGAGFEPGPNCPICHRDDHSEPEIDQIIIAMSKFRELHDGQYYKALPSKQVGLTNEQRDTTS